MDEKVKQKAQERLERIRKSYSEIERGKAAPETLKEIEINADTGEVGGTMGAGLGGTPGSNGE